MRKKFKVFDHTADLGLTVYGKTLQELFENAALGMYSFLTDTKKIKNLVKEKVIVKGNDMESLLINWLNELLYLTYSKRIVFNKFRITNLGEYFLDGEAKGKIIDTKVKPLDTEIKAATYSGLKVNKTAGGYKTRIIFDV